MRAHMCLHAQASTAQNASNAPSQPHMPHLGRSVRAWGQPGCTSSSRALTSRGVPKRLAEALNNSGQRMLPGRLHSGMTTPVTGSAYSTQTAHEVVKRFYQGLNQRDLATVSGCFAPDATYENLAVEGVLAGREAVAQFCVDSISAVPDDAVFAVQQQTEGAGSSVAVVWRLVISSSQTTMSRGIAFYTFNQQGLISGVTECHEHPVKVTHSSLALVRPLVKSLSGPMLPAVQEVNRTIQQGMGSLMEPLNALASLVQQPPLQPPAQPPSTTAAAPEPLTPGSGGAVAGASTAWRPSPTPATTQQQQSPPMSTSKVNSSPATSSSSSSGAGSMPDATRSGMSSGFAPSASSQPTAAAAGSRPASPYARVQAAAIRRSAASTPATAAYGGAAGAQHNVADLSGLWAKDAARSDAKGYEAMLDVLGLSGLQKVTARLIEGIEVKQTSDQFIVGFVTVVPFFKVTETVPLNAGSTQQSRRDLRPGRQTATAKTVNEGVLVEMSWGQPMAGSLTELYTLLPDGSLCVHAEARVGQQQAAADSIYVRAQGSRDALLSDSRRRNGSFNDVLKRQQQQNLSL